MPFSSQDHKHEPLLLLLSLLMATLNSLLFRLSSYPTFHQFDQIHAHYITSGLLRSTFLANHLLKSSSFLSPDLTLVLFSQLDFPDLFSYNVAIKSLSQTSHPLKSFALYLSLLLRGFHPNEYTFCFLLDCCSNSLAHLQGRQLHAQLIKHGLNLTMFSSTSLLHTYGCCGSIDDAYQLFDELPMKSNVSWGAMINNFVTHGELLRGLKLFALMFRSGLSPTNATLVGILCLCAKQGELDIGRAMHGYIVASGLELNMMLGTSLVDMYSNCGLIGTAMEVFASMPVKNVASWNCLIFGLANNGYGVKVLELFEQMKQELKVRPNGVTFLGVLQACTHAGLVENGVQYFIQMSRDYGIMPSLKHYGCIVDLYGKAGKFKEAMEVIRTMPMNPDNVIWVALFSACRTHGYRELGELMSASFIKLGADDSCGYILLSDAYAIRKRFDDVVFIRSMMREMDIKKVPGFSSTC
ncbi:hypothetical protein M5K25_011080 [Dendrobium thyrsiflorum]|uniref:Pentatricopeptide repeat-containing protein n=1 Tax=Dendrobium thyrsiflorum TaxID=117978 RepID=A0ABD0V2B0_DENTH